MRKFIIGFSICCFALSGIIIVKALEVPAYSPGYQNPPMDIIQKAPSAESAEIIREFTREQAANRALVKDLQTTISRLENRLSVKDKEQPTTVKTGEPEIKPRVLAVLGGGTFQSGQVVVSVDLMNVVKKMVRDIQAAADHRVVIEGHTDNIPIKFSSGSQYRNNMELSYLRAKAISNILAEQGVPPEKMSVIGYGDTRPIASNETVAGRARNRRVEVKLVSKQREF